MCDESFEQVDLDSKKLRHTTPLKVDVLDTNNPCDLHFRHPHLKMLRETVSDHGLYLCPIWSELVE